MPAWLVLPQSGPRILGLHQLLLGAALQPFRGTRPLLQMTARVSEIFWKAGAVTRQAFLPRHAQDLWERPCVAIGLRSSPWVSAQMHKLLGLLCSPIATQRRSHKWGSAGRRNGSSHSSHATPASGRLPAGSADHLISGTPLSFCSSSKSMSAQISTTFSPSVVTSSTARSV